MNAEVERELQRAIKLYPLDLVERLDHLHARWDRCDADDMAEVVEAIRIGRSEVIA